MRTEFKEPASTCQTEDCHHTCAEHWKSVPGTGGDYQASNRGRIRSTKSGVPTLLKVNYDASGRPWVQTVINGKKKRRKICDLVAAAFVQNPYSLSTVGHLDQNPQNNIAENLFWASDKEVRRHMADTIPPSRHPAIRIMETGDLFGSPRSVADYLGVTKKEVKACLSTGSTLKGYHVRYNGVKLRGFFSCLFGGN